MIHYRYRHHMLQTPPVQRNPRAGHDDDGDFDDDCEAGGGDCGCGDGDYDDGGHVGRHVADVADADG